MGLRTDPGSGERLGEVVHVSKHVTDGGPAENAFVFVELGTEQPRGHYISWIGYYDIDYVAEREIDSWLVVEPHEEYERDVEWLPYGWSGAIHVPSIAEYMVSAMGRD